MKTLRTIFTGILTVIVLISSVSQSVSFHLCGGEVQNISFFGSAQTCTEHSRGCDHDGGVPHGDSFSHKGCCEDATVTIGSAKYSSKDETVGMRPLLEAFQLFTEPRESFISFVAPAHGRFFNYRPPLIERDITILVQAFLI